MSYADGFNACKAAYPFETTWKDNFQHGMEQYTPEARAAAQRIFDRLIEGLAALGEMAPEPAKVDLFRQAVLALNELNEEDFSLIETGEREELCDLVNLIGEAAGIPSNKYGSGEGLASEWREW